MPLNLAIPEGPCWCIGWALGFRDVGFKALGFEGFWFKGLKGLGFWEVIIWRALRAFST